MGKYNECARVKKILSLSLLIYLWRREREREREREETTWLSSLSLSTLIRCRRCPRDRQTRRQPRPRRGPIAKLAGGIPSCPSRGRKLRYSDDSILLLLLSSTPISVAEQDRGLHIRKPENIFFEEESRPSPSNQPRKP